MSIHEGRSEEEVLQAVKRALECAICGPALKAGALAVEYHAKDDVHVAVVA